MAEKTDWIFWGIVLLGGFFVGYLLEQHFHLIENLFGIPSTAGNTPSQPSPQPIAAQAPQPVPPAKLYPNPLYNPYLDNDWDNLDDSWYYMY